MKRFKDIFKKKSEVIYAPISGKVVPISEVNDPTFSEEIVGKGIAIIPDSGEIVAPADGKLESVFPTGHAFTMITDSGTEILVHFGLNTVSLKGECFEILVEAGQRVKKGDLLIKVDIDEIRKRGFELITPVVICNPYLFNEIKGISLNENISNGEMVLVLS